MKHVNYFLCTMILFSFFIISCDKAEPVASFTMSKTSAEAGELISFTNTSENATSYSWNFGDGNTSSDSNPTHSYSNGGTFTVTLTAIGDEGENTASKTIEVIHPAEVVIVGNPVPSGGIINGNFFLIVDGEVENIGALEAYNVKVHYSQGNNSATIETEPSTIAAGGTATFSKTLFNASPPTVAAEYYVTWD